MTETTFTIEDVSLIDFLGIGNLNIRELALAFPKSKIISRGNEIKIQGSESDIGRINDILEAMMIHYQKYGSVTKEVIHQYLVREDSHTTEGQNLEVVEEDVILYGNKGIVVRARTANQKKMVQSLKDNDLFFAVGPAGTGKTYTAVALAIRALKNKEVKKLVITRPAVEAGENLGFLPGDLKDKIDPYLRPIYDALEDMIPMEKLKYYKENNIIEIAPLAYMRGRTLNHAFIILDEAQNTTPQQMKMFLTRMGSSSKVIITGDKTQIDLPSRQRSGLVHALSVLKGIRGIGIVELDGKDVLRHRLVKDIVNAYDKSEKKEEKEKAERENPKPEKAEKPDKNAKA